MKKNIHVIPNGSKWAVKGAGNKTSTKITITQKEAITIAREMAKNQKSELVIHGKNGAIRAKDSYGNDPINVKG